MNKKCTMSYSMSHTDEKAELKPTGKAFESDNRRWVTDMT